MHLDDEFDIDVRLASPSDVGSGGGDKLPPFQTVSTCHTKCNQHTCADTCHRTCSTCHTNCQQKTCDVTCPQNICTKNAC